MEDIYFLEKNSTKEAYLFQSDSGQRDKVAWPSPSEYEIVFDTPFKHVVGLDIIDASIPRTQYTVDTHNNLLVLSVDDGSPQSVYLDVGDHNETTIVDELNAKLKDAYGITAAHLSNPTILKNSIYFTSNRPFYFDFELSTCREILGFSVHATSSRWLGTYFLADERLANPFIYRSIAEAPNVTLTFTGSADASAKFGESETGMYVAQRVISISSGTLSEIRIAFKTSDSQETATVVPWIFCDMDVATGDPGKVLARGDIVALNYLESGYSSTGSVARQKAYIESNTYYWIVFRLPPNVAALGGITQDTGNILMSTDSLTWYDVDNNDNPYLGKLACNVAVSQSKEKLVAPGILNLAGEPYIMLRIPEIESHLYRSRAFERYSFGVAKFKLGIVGFANDRFDYSSVPPRSFHPIGKLDKLTMKFITGSGKLYDFKGVDHQILIVVRYLQPVQMEPFNTKLLNPDYEPDDIKRLRNMKTTDDTDSEEEDVNRDPHDRKLLYVSDPEVMSEDEADDMERLRILERGIYGRYMQ